MSSRNGIKRIWPASGIAASLLSGAALLVRFPPERYPVYPPCPIHAWTGLLCPGCGATGALAALLRGQAGEALHRNGLVTLLLPLAALGLLLPAARNRLGRLTVRSPGVLALALVTAVFTIWRNL